MKIQKMHSMKKDKIIKAIACNNIFNLKKLAVGESIELISIEKFKEAYDYLVDNQANSQNFQYNPIVAADFEGTLQGLMKYVEAQSFDSLPQNIIDNIKRCLIVLEQWESALIIKH